MSEKTMVEQLADWATAKTFADLTDADLAALKGRVLDALGCAIGGLHSNVLQDIRRLTQTISPTGAVTLIGGGNSAPDDATFYNGAAVRYLDYNDSYLAKGETCHPSDNVAPVLAATEYHHGSGRDFLLGLAIAYQVQCRLSDVAPVRAHGWDHTVQGQYGAAAGAAKAMGLTSTQMANAVAISGTGYNSLRVTRTGDLSNWKGLAYPNTAKGAVFSTLLAEYGITGPAAVFEGNKGLMDTITGPFKLDWSKEDLSAVTRTIIKRYNAEIHSQSSIEGLLALRQKYQIPAADIKAIRLQTFDVAFNIIGGGEEGPKKSIHTKEEADHSLPYLLAVAYLDGQVLPAQYTPERIQNNDVQQLLQKVDVTENKAFSAAFPEKMPIHLDIETTDGRVVGIDKEDYQGFTSNPATWDTLTEKFHLLAKGIDDQLADQIAAVVEHLEQHDISDLTSLLAKIN
jgi:2-methylcitrate dehydratase